jgi:hypothetical protein
MRQLCLVALVVVGAPLSAQPAGPPPQVRDPVASRFAQILSTMEKRHEISSADRSYVLSSFNGGKSPFRRGIAFICLLMEVDDGLYSGEKLMAVVEPKLATLPGREAGLYFENLSNSRYGLRGDMDRALIKERHRLKDDAKGEQQFGDAQRSLVLSALVSSSAVTRLLAGSVFIQKRNLPVDSKSWVLSRVNRQVLRSAGNERRAWEIVRRTVLARNPG